MEKAKYIITVDGSIIIFSESISHDSLKFMNPIRAGFIVFGIDKNKNVSCSCHGMSYSLGLKSDPEEDTKIAKIHLGLTDF